MVISVVKEHNVFIGTVFDKKKKTQNKTKTKTNKKDKTKPKTIMF